MLGLDQACGLPIAGFEENLETALVARDQGGIVGCPELELYGDCALLQSVAVAQPIRGQRFGQRLVRAALDLARERGVRSVYLLTETAVDLIRRHGFQAITREIVPANVQTSVEFTPACPESALAMVVKI